MAVHVVSQDLGERDGPARAVAAADALGVEIGMLVSNAGFGTYGPFLAQDSGLADRDSRSEQSRAGGARQRDRAAPGRSAGGAR